MNLSRRKLEPLLRVLGVPEEMLDACMGWEEQGDPVASTAALVCAMWRTADRAERDAMPYVKAMSSYHHLDADAAADLRALVRRVIRAVVIGISLELDSFPDPPDIPEEAVGLVSGWAVAEVDAEGEPSRVMEALTARVTEFAGRRWALLANQRFRMKSV
jgi:hypothetical protein